MSPEWRVVQTFDLLRSADPRESIAHLFARKWEKLPEEAPGLDVYLSACGKEARLRRLAPARASAKRCSRCEKAVAP